MVSSSPEGETAGSLARPNPHPKRYPLIDAAVRHAIFEAQQSLVAQLIQAQLDSQSSGEVAGNG